MKDTREVKNLIREAFKINGLAGRITCNITPDGKGSLQVWGKGLVPKVVAKIVPSIDRMYLMNEGYQEKAQKFAELYQLKYLFDDGCLRIVNLYDSNPAIALYPDEAQI
jgi:hypothetical protein